MKMPTSASAEFLGETLGTMILVFFGCGSVAASILFDAHQGLLQVALVWGVGVALAIYATRHLSCAHLNPAVSVAMALSGRMMPKKLGRYLTGQFLGAFLAAALLYGLFGSVMAQYESLHQISRGTPESSVTAAMFGEFFPAPGGTFSITTPLALAVEAVGTFFLVLLIFSLTDGCNVGRPDDTLAPLFIGLTVTVIISVVAPLTQAGLNPARDLAPRLLATLAGWGRAAWPPRPIDALWVYGLGPMLGGGLAAVLFNRIIQPRMEARSRQSGCCGKP